MQARVSDMSFDSVFGSGRGHARSLPDDEQCLWDKLEHKHGTKLVDSLLEEIREGSLERTYSVLNQTTRGNATPVSHENYPQWAANNPLPARLLDGLAGAYTPSVESLIARLWIACMPEKRQNNYDAALGMCEAALREPMACNILYVAIAGNLGKDDIEFLSPKRQRTIFSEVIGKELHRQQKTVMKRLGHKDRRPLVHIPRGWRMSPDDWTLLAAKWWTWQGTDGKETLDELVKEFVSVNCRRTQLKNIFGKHPIYGGKHKFSMKVETRRLSSLKKQQVINQRLLDFQNEVVVLLDEKIELIKQLEHFELEMHVCAAAAQRTGLPSAKKSFLADEQRYKQQMETVQVEIDKNDTEHDIKKYAIKSLTAQYDRLPLSELK